MSSNGRIGRDDELFHRPRFLLADDGHRGQHHGHDHQEKAEDARDHEVAAPELGVVPDPDLGPEPDGARAGAADLLEPFEEYALREPRGDEAGIVQPDRRGLAFGAVRDELDPRGPPGGEPRRRTPAAR